VSLTWPDLVIGGIALLFALKGWKRGFVGEISGAIALAGAPSGLRGRPEGRGRVGPGTASGPPWRPGFGSNDGCGPVAQWLEQGTHNCRSTSARPNQAERLRLYA